MQSCPLCNGTKSKALNEPVRSDYYVEIGSVKFKAIERQNRKCSKKSCSQCFIASKLIKDDTAEVSESTEVSESCES